MKLVRVGIVLAAVLCVPAVRADGLVIDKIYHPYVDALEQEIEYRAVVQDEQPGLSTQAQIHKLAFGKTLGSRMFAEVYMLGSRSRGGEVSLEAWEAEARWQLTEKGEYSADWGLQMEYGHERRIDAEEFSVALLAEKEWEKWSGVANLRLVNEWGDDIKSETDTVLALQARYRYARGFEPGVEFYAGQHTRGLGPVLQGTIGTGIRQNLHWEAGLIFGLDHQSAERTWRVLFEYEF